MLYRFYNKTPLLLFLTTAWLLTNAQAFAPPSPARGVGWSNVPTQQQHQQQQRSPAYTHMARIRHQGRAQSSLKVVADAEQDEKKRRKDSSSDNANDWTPTASGGFLPNLAQRFTAGDSSSTEKPLMTEVTSLQDYKDHVVDYKDGLVCGTFTFLTLLRSYYE